MDQLPRLGKRELVCLLLFTCNYVVSVLGRFPPPLGAWDGRRYFIVAFYIIILEKKKLKGFYHIWAWRPSWSGFL